MHSYEYLPSTCPVPGTALGLRAGRHRGLSQPSRADTRLRAVDKRDKYVNMEMSETYGRSLNCQGLGAETRRA